MYTRRARNLNVIPLTILSKFCFPRTNSHFLKTMTFLKNFSTAMDRFHNVNGYVYDEVSSEYDQNITQSQNLRLSQQIPSGKNNVRVFEEKSDGLRGSFKEFQHSLNSNWGYREDYVNDFVQNPFGQNGNSGGLSWSNNGNFNSSSCEHYKNSCIFRDESWSNTSFNKSFGHGNFTGSYGQNSAVSLQSSNGFCVDSSSAFTNRPHEFSRSSGMPKMGNKTNEFHNYSVQQGRSFSGYYGKMVGELQHSYAMDGAYGGNVSMQITNSSQEGSVEVRQNKDGTSWSHGSPNVIYTNNFAQLQQSSNAYYSGNVGEWPQNSNLQQYHPNANAIQTNTVGSHALSHPKSEGTPNGGSECSPYSGTLEELDNFCQEGKLKEALEVMRLLDKQQFPVDFVRYLCLIQMCGETKALEEAKVVHEVIIRSLSPLKLSIYNRILEMYLKCGSVEDAFSVFNQMPSRNLTSWDTMITGLSKNGLGEDAIDLFTQFKRIGLKPDGQMFIGVFNACSALFDTDEGIQHFRSMKKDFDIVPTMTHYVSMVDMLGSAGYLDEALEFIEKMPLVPSVDVWETLMNLCRIHGNLELGDRCAELVEQLDPSCLSDQSKAGLVHVKASDIVKEKEKKLASHNLLEIRSRVHEYRAGDRSHPDNDKIYALLRGLREQMKEVGYIADTRFVLHDIDQEGKEDALLAHSERLAVANGLLSSSVRSPIRVIKNLRFCGDCHSAMKLISKIVGRELIIRDAKRFHHFKDGLCSCRDYW